MSRLFHLRLIAGGAIMIVPGTLWSQWANCSGTTSDTCTTQNAGIGTVSPGGALEIDTLSTSAKPLIVRGPSSPGADLLTLYGFAGNPVFTVTTYGGGTFKDIVAIGTAPSSNQELIVSNSSGPTRNGVVVKGTMSQTGDLQQWQDNSGTPLAVVTSEGHIGVGTAFPQSALAVNGTVTAKEVVVANTGWPDYVFAPEYQLRPLSQTAAYIERNRHLPDIPSMAEVAEKGVSLGEMQAKLLAKIEELTLHMIDEEKHNRQIEQENRDLRRRIESLESESARRKE